MLIILTSVIYGRKLGTYPYYIFFRELERIREQEKAQKKANMMKYSTRYKSPIILR